MTEPITAIILNPLTGSFDAAVQVSRPTVDRLLATMHQNHGNDAGLPTLPHRVVVRIGDVTQTETPPPGAPIITINIRGTAWVQIGVPAVSFVGQAPRDVDLSCWIRVRYRPDPGTVPLPEFIHGKIVARVSVQPESVGGIAGLRATVSPDDAHVVFTDSGLAGDDLKHVSYVLRSFLRNRVDAFLELPADLPPAVGDFRTMQDTQGRQALALPFTLQGPPPAEGALGLVFLDGSDFAIAVSAAFIRSLIQPQLDALKAAHPTFSAVGATYTVSITKAEATWLPDGRIHIEIEGKATTPPWWAPNVNFGVSQDLQLVIHFPAFGGGPVVSVVPIGAPDPWATSKWHPAKKQLLSLARNKVRAQFAAARDAALAQAQPLIAQSLDKTQLLRDLLVRIDDAAALEWEKAVPSAAGMTLRGSIALSPRKAPRVEFTELGDGSGYTAFKSWVPGGRIESFYWTWWRSGDPISPLTNTPKSYFATFADRYVLQEEKLPTLLAPPPSSSGAQPATGVVTPLPAGSLPVSASGAPGMAFDGQAAGPVWGQACVSITGKYVDPKTGKMTGAWAQAVIDPGLACSFAGFSPIPVQWEEFPIPPPIGGDPPPFQLRVNVLVYAPAELEAITEGAVLVQAIQQVDRHDAGLVLVVRSRISPHGPSRPLAHQARELQRELPQLAVLLASRDARWLRGLGLPVDDSRPALRLIDPTGRVVWEHDGAADASTLAAALRTHLVPSTPPRARLLRTTARAGDPAPDFTFELEGRRAMLHRLRGRRVAVAFPPSDETEAAALLDRLSARPAETDEPRPLVVVVRGGDSAPTARRPRGFDFGTVADPEGIIARGYGIQIRPTIVLIDWDGRVSTVQMMGTGMVPPQPPPGDGGSAPS